MTNAVETLVEDGYQLTAKDAAQLRMADEEYKKMSWEDLKTVIAENRLEDLKRVPSDLKRYRAWSARTRVEYGSIQAFVLQNRLGWTDLIAKNPKPYEDPEDTKILPNDWPYGMVPGILHLVAWTKAPIATMDGDGDLTPESRKVLEEFVDRTFVKRLGKDNVLWFKNWASIQSVRSVEHIHILVRGYDESFVEEVVGKDVGRAIGEVVKEDEEQGLKN